MQPAHRIRHDAVIDVVQILVGIGAYGLGALQEGQGHGACLSAAETAHKEEVLAPDGKGTDGVFCGVVVDLQPAIGRVAVEGFALVDRVADRFGSSDEGRMIRSEAIWPIRS